jgi:hypothetical protein
MSQNPDLYKPKNVDQRVTQDRNRNTVIGFFAVVNRIHNWLFTVPIKTQPTTCGIKNCRGRRNLQVYRPHQHSCRLI